MNIRLTLYYRQHCHLCEQMLAELKSVAADLDIEVSLVDIDRDETLKSRYDAQVPVLADGETVICRYFFEEQPFREHLKLHG